MPKTSEAMLRAIAKYQQENCKVVSVKFFPSDMELYDHICGYEQKSTYIKELIRRDMEGVSR